MSMCRRTVSAPGCRPLGPYATPLMIHWMLPLPLVRRTWGWPGQPGPLVGTGSGPVHVLQAQQQELPPPQKKTSDSGYLFFLLGKPLSQFCRGAYTVANIYKGGRCRFIPSIILLWVSCWKNHKMSISYVIIWFKLGQLLLEGSSVAMN